ncbi:MAG TPA: serine/threonine-protein kinase [Vicinamibacterales bacterium]|nr:serine/threonine-protein kinase [Vicinamibacterales bacterium]
MTTVFKQVGPYHILRQIGHGGMAVVFLALDTRSNRRVALKLVQRSGDREAQEIVEAEQFGAELQKRFSERGAHVPAVYEYGIDEDSGYFYVAMEYVDGENLSEVIANGPLLPTRAADVAIELARFLEEAHAFEAVVNGRNLNALLHLDLKPRNVRITSAQLVKVLDFGTAKALSLSRKVTRNDFGSVAYLSPERLETGEVDARADLWALGVVLYEMVRGIPPFQAADTRRLERLILARRPPPSLTEQCPPGLAAVVSRLLDPSPEERYASAREIREDLERFKAGRQTVAEERGWPARAYDDAATRRTSPVAPAVAVPQMIGSVPVGPGTARTPPVDDADKTRRTVSPPVPPPIPTALTPPASAAIPAPPVPPKASPSRLRRLFKGALVLIGFGLLVSEISIGSEAGRLARAASTHGFAQLPRAWEQYDNLLGRSNLGMGTHDLREALIDRTTTLADRVIANYRSPTPTVREAQWTAARDALSQALSRAGDDRRLRSALRYCEGHLHRINGEAKKARGEVDPASDDLTEAVVAFREAHDLRQDWSDPFLGLFRTFIVGLDDVERGADALMQAEQRGYEASERDVALLGDGYRTQGNMLVRSARQLADLPQGREYLVLAADAYRLALANYARAGSLATVPQSIARTQRALLQVEESLGEGVTVDSGTTGEQQ